MRKINLLLSACACLFFGCEKQEIADPAPSTQGLVLYLPFNNSLNDASSELNHATMVGSASSFLPNRYFDQNSAIRISEGQYLEVQDRKFSTLKSFTFYIEFYPSGPGYQSLISKRAYVVRPGVKYNSSFNIAINDLGQARAQVRKIGQCQVELPTSFYPEITSGNELVMENCWNYVACTYDGKTQKLYLNGKLVAQQNLDGMEICDTDPLRIGSWWQGDTQFFDGVLDEVRVYDRALPDNEIFQLYKYAKR
jgi:hypothetical protein